MENSSCVMPAGFMEKIQRQMQVGYKKNLAKNLAGITNDIEEPSEPSDYFKRVFKTKDSVL